jgi:hypothetical protein
METNESTTPFLLLFRNTGPATFAHLSPTQRERLVDRWNRWYEELTAAGKATEGQPLQAESRLVAGPGGQRIVDGPYPEAKEAVGGYVKLLVSDLDEATEIARRHPALEHGMMIEVRPLTPDCHLGVTAHHQSAAAAVH